MYNPWKHAQDQAAIRASLQIGNTCTPSITAAAAEALESHMTEYIREQVWLVILILNVCVMIMFKLYVGFIILLCTTDQLALHGQTFEDCSGYYSSYEGNKQIWEWSIYIP